MTTKQLEKRVAKLESEFEQLKAGLRNTNGKDWRAVVGTHEGSSTFDSVVQEMNRLRRKDYEEADHENADS
jgi:hypothetical protein